MSYTGGRGDKLGEPAGKWTIDDFRLTSGESPIRRFLSALTGRARGDQVPPEFLERLRKFQREVLGKAG
jgi:hypothetical protein